VLGVSQVAAKIALAVWSAYHDALMRNSDWPGCSLIIIIIIIPSTHWLLAV
jgi:hypothetical protein